MTKDKTLAFPCTDANGVNNGVCGMELRDYFAGLALQALLINFKDRTPDPAIPEWTYDWADAMMEARK